MQKIIKNRTLKPKSGQPPQAPNLIAFSTTLSQKTFFELPTAFAEFLTTKLTHKKLPFSTRTRTVLVDRKIFILNFRITGTCSTCFVCVPNRFFSREDFVSYSWLKNNIKRLKHTPKDHRRSPLSLLRAHRPLHITVHRLFMKIHFQFTSVIALRRLPFFTNFPSARSDCSATIASDFRFAEKGNWTSITFVTVEIERNRCDGRERLYEFLAVNFSRKKRFIVKRVKIFRRECVGG